MTRSAYDATRWVAPDALADLPVRTRGLPKDHAGDVRLVEIVGVDLNTCGGPHVSRLGEIQTLHVVGVERARGGARITFLAGGRGADVVPHPLAHGDDALAERVIVIDDEDVGHGVSGITAKVATEAR